MAITQKDIKLLWGRSGNRCAICRTELTHDAATVTVSFTLGEQAHIVGEKLSAARGQSPLTDEERNSYHNLILLCPNHHTEIDKNQTDWPVEKLHQVKSIHELWVSETLSNQVDQRKLANEIAIASTIDAAIMLCQLENWTNWTCNAYAPDPQWPENLINDIFQYRQKIIVSTPLWNPEYQELKRATITLSIALHLAAQKFQKHCIHEGDVLIPDKFYRNSRKYDVDLKAYLDWLDDCYEFLRLATKAANWFADCVRNQINPLFFAEKGKFLIIEFSGLSNQALLLEFTQEEKNLLPDTLEI